MAKNLEKLEATGFFSDEFITNYDQIILTLDKKLRNKELDQWRVGDLPPFKFANDVDPWCMCQGYSSQQFDRIELIALDSMSGSFYWKWKKGNDWLDFEFRVVREQGRWKIAYMQGFEYQRAVKRADEI